MSDPNSSDKGQEGATVGKSYSAGRSFLKDGEETTLMFFWHNLAVDFFVEQGNVSIEVERPIWLIDWPMTSKSLMQNIVNILKKHGGGQSLDDVAAVGPNTPAQFERIFTKLEEIERDPFMQQVMKAVLLAERGFDTLAQLCITSLDDQGLARENCIGQCQLPEGYVHVFN